MRPLLEHFMNVPHVNFMPHLVHVGQAYHGYPIPEVDPQRAETIMATLEKVPRDLIGRYEKLRAGSGEDECDSCPVCREGLLEEDPMVEERSSSVAFLAELPFCTISEPSIVAFPCPGKHVFHDMCLSPWLSRKTTCPSCRFDVDPNSLTLRWDFSSGRRRNGTDASSAHPERRTWEPPEVKPFREWLEEEENKLANPASTSSAPIKPVAPHSSERGPSSVPPRVAAVRRAATNPVLLQDAIHIYSDDDDAWTTDEEDDDEDLYGEHPPPLIPAHTASSTQPHPTLGDLDDPEYVAERRRFLRSLMDPTNPLRLFLGDEESDMPTLIPLREPHFIYPGDYEDDDDEYEDDDDADDEDEDDEPPPLMDDVIPGPPVGQRRSEQHDEEDEGEDDLPPLIGEPERRRPSPDAHRGMAFPPWLDPDAEHNPARSFTLLNEWARMFASLPPDDYDLD